MNRRHYLRAAGVSLATASLPLAGAAERTPNDPEYPEQWHLRAINAPAAWADHGFGAPDVTLGVVGNGVDYTHPDVAPNYDGGYDALDRDSDPYPDGLADLDDGGHGTQVAAVAACGTDNGEHAAGVVNVSYRSYRTTAPTTGGYHTRGVLRAVEDGCDILVMSRSGASFEDYLDDAVRACVANDVLLVMSAGNDASAEAVYPQSHPEVLSVGATDRQGDLAHFSNYGAASDIVAPGIDLETGVGDEFGGTSGAAPIVAGVAALAQSATGKTGQDLREHLLATARDLGLSESEQGAGMIDAAAACGVEGDGGEGDTTDTETPMATIQIIGQGAAAQYRIDAPGPLEKTTTDRANINANDTIDDTTAEGEVGTAADAYRFEGSVGDATVEIDGNAVVRFGE